MSNRYQWGMPEDLMRIFIAESLEKLPPDVLWLVYRITFHSLSGLELGKE